MVTWLGLCRSSILGGGREELPEKQMAENAPRVSGGALHQAGSAGTGAALLLGGDG